MQRNGFSLIELLIAIVVIGLITSVALPNFSAIQNKAKESNITSLSYSLQTAIETYFLNNGSYPSGSNLDTAALISLLKSSGEFTSDTKNPYTGNAFDTSDTKGRIVYNFDTTSSTYTLTVYGSSTTTPVLTLGN